MRRRAGSEVSNRAAAGLAMLASGVTLTFIASAAAEGSLLIWGISLLSSVILVIAGAWVAASEALREVGGGG